MTVRALPQDSAMAPLFDLQVNTSSGEANDVLAHLGEDGSQPLKRSSIMWVSLAAISYLWFTIYYSGIMALNTSLLACNRFDLNLMTQRVTLSGKSTQMAKGLKERWRKKIFINNKWDTECKLWL